LPKPLKDALREAQESGRTLILDGAMGTELQRAGLEPGGCGELWSVERPQQLLAIHRAYAEAGSQLLLSCTFGANRFILGRHGLAGRAAELSRAAVCLARQAAGDSRWVLGDCGPCGGFLQPTGEIAPAELEASLREQIAALLEAGAEAIMFETMSALDELEMGIRVARELGAPCVIASLAFERRRSGFRTMAGARPEQAAKMAADAGADAIGANCGTGLEPPDFADIARAFRSACALPVILQPNAGKPELVGGRAAYRLTPEQMAPMVTALAPLAQVLGGCCGTGPGHIAAFAKQLA
jgi:5-methyltetrahydrofolate--homocysteine methyltransferase